MKASFHRQRPNTNSLLHMLWKTTTVIPLLYLASLLLLLLPVTVDGRAVLGIDLGSLYMKVALVRSGAPLEIVTNMHSKRKTEQMVLFDQKQRFYGADANGLLARKAQLTPATMSELLGRDASHPNVQALVDRHFPVKGVYNETRKGLTLSVPKAGDFTPEELVAMVMQHAVEISVKYAKEAGGDIPPPSDICLTVPSYYTQMERKALVDAAHLAGLNVLTMIDETTAAALHYATDKNFEGEPQIFLFYNMGASSLQVSIVKYYQMQLKQGFGKPKPTPALQVLAKSWDATLGGLSWDHVLVEHLADEFNKHWRKASGDNTKDIRSVQRPMTKLRLAANKAKHVLSANSEYPVHMDALHDDVSLHVTLTRDQLEELSKDLLERAVKPVEEALAAANLTTANLTGIELLGGGMRVPSIQTKLATVLDPVELGLHMNADESMALGAAFAGANVSTAFRVRQIGMTDTTAFAQQISLSNLGEPIAEEAEPASGWTPKFQPFKAPADAKEDSWNKKATLFKPNGKINIKKTIAFTHDQDVHCALDYVESDLHADGQELSLERYEVSGVADFVKELKEEKGLEGKPKVALQFELSASGITSLIKAEASFEETYTVEEEIEVDDDDAEDESADYATDAADAETETSADKEEAKEGDETKEEAEKKEEDSGTDEEKKDNDDASKDNETDSASAENTTAEEAPEEEKKPKKKKKIMVEKEKKRVHKKALKVSTYYESKIQPHWETLLAESKAKLAEMDAADQQRVMLEESKNRVESYMFTVKNKLIDDEEALSTVSTQEQRDECAKLASDTEMWLEDEGYTADFATMEEKYEELSAPFEKILLRLKESKTRPAMLEKLESVLVQYEELLKKWEEEKPQVTEEERQTATERIADLRANVTALEEAQAALESHEDPHYLSSDIPPKLKPIESLMQRLSKKPKPKPPKKEESNETKSDDNATDTSTNESAADGEDASASADSEGSESTSADGEEETKEGEPADADDEDGDDEL